jgi:NADH:ubiquinone oxidoreductase subunit F (NADH-binding)
MLEIYERLSRGAGADNDLNLLEELAQVMAQASLCGLGQAAAVPVTDSLRHFRGEYISRIEQSEFIRSYLGEKL